jgi:hypothetical protein
MFGFNGGELFIILFIVVAILSARFWPALGERIVLLLSGSGPRR